MRFYDGIWEIHSRKYIFSVFIRTSSSSSFNVFFLLSAFFFCSCHLLFHILSKLANKFHHVRPFCLRNFLVIMLNYNIIHPLSFNIERFERQIFIVSIDFASILLFFSPPVWRCSSKKNVACLSKCLNRGAKRTRLISKLTSAAEEEEELVNKLFLLLPNFSIMKKSLAADMLTPQYSCGYDIWG